MRELLDAIRHRRAEIEELQRGLEAAEADGVLGYYEPGVEIYQLQPAVRAARKFLAALAPAGIELNPGFLEVCRGACARRFEWEANPGDWGAETRPILEGFWHCRYFVRMLARFGCEPEAASGPMSPGRAAVLCLYGLRLED